VFKTIWFMKRKPGMSRQEFIEYYENNHRLIGERLMAGAATHYMRRFLHPVLAGGAEPVYDVVMELWFPDRATYENRMAQIWNDQATVAEVIEDETKFFDRESIVHYIAEEHTSAM